MPLTRIVAFSLSLIFRTWSALAAVGPASFSPLKAV
jgi:hypothetical protein